MKAVAAPQVDPAHVQGWLEKIGLHVARLRESLHQNQTGVATDAAVGRSGLSALENAQRAARLDTLIRVLLALNADPWTFFGGSETTRPKRRIDLQVLHDKLDDIAETEEFAMIRDVIETYHSKAKRER